MRKTKKGFTIIEIAIGLGMVVVLSVVVVVAIDPAELFRESRDNQRVTELNLLDAALQYAQHEGSLPGLDKTVYISIPDVSEFCNNLSLPALTGAWVYNCALDTNYRALDGTGWIPLAAAGLPASMAQLPIDPINKIDPQNSYYYAYLKDGGKYELIAGLESSKVLARLGNGDGGIDPARLEIGPSLTLLTDSGGGYLGSIAMVSAQSTHTGASPQVQSFGVPNTAGNLIVLAAQVSAPAGSSDPIISDTNANTYQKILGPIADSGGGTTGWLYYAKNIAGGNNEVSVTAPGGSSNLGFHIAEFRGLNTVAPLDQNTFRVADLPTFTWSTPSITTVQNNELIFAFGGNTTQPGAASVGSPYSIVSEETTHQSLSEYYVAGAAGSHEASMTGPTETGWIMLLATFKGASVSSPSPTPSPSPSPSPTPPVLVGHWQFDNNPDDISGNGNNGTLEEGASYIGGQIGQALNLDGANDYVHVPDNGALNLEGDYSVSVWVNGNANQSDWGAIYAKTTNDVDAAYTLQFMDDAPDRSLVVFHDNASQPFYTGISQSMLQGAWHHIAITRSVITQKAYLDGVEIGSDPYFGTPESVGAGVLRIGEARTVGYPFSGKVDDFRIYSGALSPAAIQTIYSQGLQGLTLQGQAESYQGGVLGTVGSFLKNLLLLFY